MRSGNATGAERVPNERVVAAQDQRAIADRRTLTWRTVLYGYLYSRRRNTRRAAEGTPVFSDWHHPWLFFLATGIMLFSSMDAYFTLRLLEFGATELNPVMAVMIESSTAYFASSKLFLTGVGILLLVFVANTRLFNRIRVGAVLTGCFSFYASLVCYEFVYLMSHL